MVKKLQMSSDSVKKWQLCNNYAIGALADNKALLIWNSNNNALSRIEIRANEHFSYVDHDRFIRFQSNATYKREDTGIYDIATGKFLFCTNEPVHITAISENGNYFAVQQEEDNVSTDIKESVSNKVIATIEHKRYGRVMHIGDDGKYCLIRFDNGYKAYIYNIEKNCVSPTYLAGDCIERRFCILNDNYYSHVHYKDGHNVDIFDLKDNKLIMKSIVPSNFVCFNHDGNQFAVIDFKGNGSYCVQFYNIPNGFSHETNVITKQPGWIYGRFSTSGNYYYVTNSYPPYKMQIFDSHNGALLHTQAGHSFSNSDDDFFWCIDENNSDITKIGFDEDVSTKDISLPDLLVLDHANNFGLCKSCNQKELSTLSGDVTTKLEHLKKITATCTHCGYTSGGGYFEFKD